MLLRAILDRFVLVAATIAAGGMSGFPGHVLQRMAGRLDQINEDIHRFQQIADRHHEGSLQSLVAHNLASADPSVQEQGEAIGRMLADQALLDEIHAALAAGTWEQGLVMFSRVDSADLFAALEHYQPSLVFSVEGLVFAGLLGVSGWLVFMGGWHGCARLIGRR